MNIASDFRALPRCRTTFPLVLLLVASVTRAACAIEVQTVGRSRPVNSARRLPAAQGARVLRLTPSAPMKRRIAAKTVHSYQVIVERDQFLHVTVGQHYVDLVAAVFDPAGNEIERLNGLKRGNRPERVKIIAETAGAYLIEVSAVGETTGSYQIKLEELRTPTPLDRKRFAAAMAFHAGARLLRKPTAESRRAALEKYDEARLLAKEIGDRNSEAHALLRIGQIHRDLRQYDQAIRAHLEAAEAFRRVPNHPAEAVELDAVGSIYSLIDDSLKALDFISRALALCETSKCSLGLTATIHHNMGAAYYHLGERQQAIDHYERALSLFKEDGNKDINAGTFNNLGRLYYSMGDYTSALRDYEIALAKVRAAGAQDKEAIVLNNMGNTYLSMGRKEKALEYYNLALPIRRAVKDPKGIATTLANIGNVYISLGENQKALDYLNQAFSLASEPGSRQVRAVTHFRIGMVNEAMGELQSAIDNYNQALQLSRSILDHDTQSAALFALARVNRKRGDLDEARANIENALELVEILRGKMLSPEMRASYLATVSDYYDLYIDLLMQLDRMQPDRGFNALALRAAERKRARSQSEMLSESHVDITEGVDPALLAQEQSLRDRINEKSRKYANPRAGRSEQQASLKAEIDEMLTQYRNLQGRIREASPRYAALMMPQPFTVEQIQKEVLDDDTLLLEYNLGEERSYLWLVSKESLTTFELPKRTEIERAANKLRESFADLGRASLASGALARRELHANKRGEFAKAADELSRMILSPAVPHLADKRLLIVADGTLNYVPFAALPIVDETKPKINRTTDDSRPLLLDHEIVSMPSASTMGILRREFARRAVPSKAVAVFADSVFDASDDRVRRGAGRQTPGQAQVARSRSLNLGEPVKATVERSAARYGLGRGSPLQRLAFSRQEAQAISDLAAGNATLKLLDFDSTKAAVMDVKLKDYRIVHFATHGLLDDEYPELSGIVMSLVDRQGKPQDGFVRLIDIYNMELNADLVVLSGCQTALGKNVRAEGLVGLTRGFMYAGAARVVASLWKVDDEATQELMQRFYQAVLRNGEKPAAALRTAQLWMRQQERWRSRYYWAGFVLQGEWR